VSASPENPLRGGCGCGAVRFEIRAPLHAARYCHCRRCQRRTGAAASASARIGRADFEILSGADLIRYWEPPGGMPKAYCGECGGHLFAGSLEGDPGIRPESRQWVSSAAAWEPIPDDGLPRYDEAAP
jgi:hypothetical protein